MVCVDDGTKCNIKIQCEQIKMHKLKYSRCIVNDRGMGVIVKKYWMGGELLKHWEI